MYKDRIEAGKKLCQKLMEKVPQISNGIILALPRGGVVVANEIAKTLKLPLDIIVTRKIGSPLSEEYAVAAVSEHEIVLNPREKSDRKYLTSESTKERTEIQRRLKEYRGDRKKLDLRNRTIILIDDGLATGLTMEVAISEVKRQNPKKIIVAVPVAPPETAEKIKSQIDELIVLNIEPIFFAVGQFYKFFPQVSDNEVKGILKLFKNDS